MPCVSRRGLWPALALLAALLAPLSAAGEADIALDETRRAALAELPAIANGPDSAKALEDRVVVLAFFASWCPPCHPEFDALKAVDEGYRARGVSVVAVNIFEDYIGGGDRSRLAGFLAAKAPGFAVLGEGERVAPLFGAVDRIPTLFVFGRDGRPALHFVHGRGAKKTHASLEEIEAAVRAAL